MGGIKGKIFERIAKYGNGWYAPAGDPAEMKGHLENLSKACEAVGRDMDEIEVTCMWAGMGGKDFLNQLEEVGVHRAVMPMMGGPDVAKTLTSIAEDVM